MQIGEITTANSKGQIVIPKKIRKDLGITTGTAIKILSKGHGIYLFPIKGFITSEESEDSYIKMLEQTAGSWGEIPETKTKKSIELEASLKRKTQW